MKEMIDWIITFAVAFMAIFSIHISYTAAKEATSARSVANYLRDVVSSRSLVSHVIRTVSDDIIRCASRLEGVDDVVVKEFLKALDEVRNC